MLPEVDSNLNIVTQIQSSKTFKLNADKNIINSYVDELEALKQTIYLILSIERYENLIYSWNYGMETKDLIGEDYSYVCSELKRRIAEALTQDDRINSVDSFLFEKNKGKVHVTFTAHTIYGDTDEEAEVSI